MAVLETSTSILTPQRGPAPSAVWLAQDDNRLLVHRDYLPAFEKRGWRSVADVMNDSDCEVVRRVDQRDNCRLTLHGPNGEIRAYLKRHAITGVVARMRTRLRGPLAAAPGIAEARAAEALSRARVPTVEVIASGWRLAERPWRVESFFLSAEVSRGCPADDYWKRHLAHSSDTERKDRFLAALAKTARGLHQARLFHRDFYWCHFFVREQSDGDFIAHLIDLQRIERRRFDAARWLLKDLAQFRFSMAEHAHCADRWTRWFAHYRHHAPASPASRFLDTAIGIRAACYRFKEKRR